MEMNPVTDLYSNHSFDTFFTCMLLGYCILLYKTGIEQGCVKIDWVMSAQNLTPVFKTILFSWLSPFFTLIDAIFGTLEEIYFVLIVTFILIPLALSFVVYWFPRMNNTEISK